MNWSRNWACNQRIPYLSKSEVVLSSDGFSDQSGEHSKPKGSPKPLIVIVATSRATRITAIRLSSSSTHNVASFQPFLKFLDVLKSLELPLSVLERTMHRKALRHSYSDVLHRNSDFGWFGPGTLYDRLGTSTLRKNPGIFLSGDLLFSKSAIFFSVGFYFCKKITINRFKNFRLRR